jgi:hypothetical protein
VGNVNDPKHWRDRACRQAVMTCRTIPMPALLTTGQPQLARKRECGSDRQLDLRME